VLQLVVKWVQVRLQAALGRIDAEVIVGTMPSAVGVAVVAVAAVTVAAVVAVVIGVIVQQKHILTNIDRKAIVKGTSDALVETHIIGSVGYTNTGVHINTISRSIRNKYKRHIHTNTLQPHQHQHLRKMYKVADSAGLSQKTKLYEHIVMSVFRILVFCLNHMAHMYSTRYT
jgi:hypothetical protein